MSRFLRTARRSPTSRINQIYLRQIHETVTQPIRGTNVDPVELAFSPDGEWLAFFVPSSIGAGLEDAVLKKIAVTGGTPVGLGVRGAPRGLRWQGGTIVFSAGGRIQTVPDTGNSEPTTIASRLDNEPVWLEQPQLLNEGRDVLYTVRPTGGSAGAAQIVVQPVAGGERRTLVVSGTDGRLLPGGTLAFVRDSTLFVQAFDAAGLRVSGGAIPLIEGVRVAGTTGAGQFDVAGNGTLIFAPGSTVEGGAMVWVDRQGREEALAAARQEYYLPRVSPDGSKVAVSTSGTSDRDLFVWDDQRKTMTKLTSDAGEESYPVWSRDSRFLYYRANPDGAFDVFRRSADGAGTAERLTTSKETNTTPLSLLPGGEKLLVRAGVSATDHGQPADDASRVRRITRWRP